MPSVTIQRALSGGPSEWAAYDRNVLGDDDQAERLVSLAFVILCLVVIFAAGGGRAPRLYAVALTVHVVRASLGSPLRLQRIRSEVLCFGK